MAQLADSLTIDKQKARIAGTDYNKEGVRKGKYLYSANTLLHSNHISSGATGQWKEALKPEEVALVEYYFHPWLTGKGYALQATEAQRNKAGQQYQKAAEQSNSPGMLSKAKQLIKPFVPPIVLQLAGKGQAAQPTAPAHHPPAIEPQPELVGAHSQFGEDLIIDAIFGGQATGFFVDVGANHPTKLSNTNRFYQRGWRGINIEPQTTNHKLFVEARPNDINLNIGVGSQPGQLTFYELEYPTLSTFDEQTANENAQKFQVPITATYAVQVKPLTEVFAQHLPQGTVVDFMSIDTEGFEMQVLQGNNWQLYRPRLVVLEFGRDLNEIHALMVQNQYALVCKNHVNAFYLDQNAVPHANS